MNPTRILVTGVPGIGKTTLVRAVVERLEGTLRVAGFSTAEERGPQGRTGFKVVALDGRVGRLATTSGGKGPRVGRYSVLLDSFEAIALDATAPRSGVSL